MLISLQVVPSGDISVMPQAWITSTPSALSVRIMAGGHAEPPITVRRNDENFRPLPCTCCSRPSHTVGTPAEKLTCSCSNSSYSEAPSSFGPGNTSLAPTSGTEYGRPQALTWNIGTTGRITSCAEQPSASGSADPYECSTVERCEYSAPFGLPVVPDV